MFDPTRRLAPLSILILGSALGACLSVPADTSSAAAPGLEQAAPAKPVAAAKQPAAAKKPDQARKAAPAKADANKKSTKEKVGEKEEELAKLERELHYAQLELKIATKKSAADVVASETAVAEARRKVELARLAHATFTTLERPLKNEENELSVDRAKRRVVEAREELAGILQIYAEEVDAPAKDEIIRRHERSVNFAERGLAIAQRKVEIADKGTLAPKLESLEWALATATSKLDQTNDENARKVIQRELDLMRKEHALDDKARAIAKAEKELKKLKATLRKENAKKAAAKKKKEEKAAAEAKAAEGAGS